MRWHIVIRTVGMVLLFNAAFMIISSLISLYNHDSGFFPLLLSALVTIVVAVFPLVFVPYTTDLNNKEGYAIVVLSWIFSCLVGLLPYVLWGWRIYAGKCMVRKCFWFYYNWLHYFEQY